jgi:hypothetical protein
MSLLDTASLIVTPNAVKEGKLYSVIPSDGSGDMSVTRATTATRVNSAGLVELVPYNLLTYSEQFDNADWGKEFTTITANNITAPNGTATADRLNLGSGTEQKFIYQAKSQNGTYTQSVYLKKGTHTFFQLAVGGDVNPYCNFDLTNGTYSAFGSTATIANVGDGWYRCTMTYTTTTGTYVYIFAVDSLSSARTASTSSTGNYYAWGAQLVEGSTAKDYQKTETRLNIPRLDYSNGTCPSLLVEPQRTNLIPYSSSFDNAVWVKDNNGSGTLPVITANYATAPDGTMSADRAQFSNIGGSGSASNYSMLIHFGLTLSTTGTATIYLKSNTSSNQEVLLYWAGGEGDVFEVTPEWQRFTLSNLTATTTGLVLGTRGGSGNFFNGGDEVLDILVWGAQLEAGSYSTSYIPTTSASVTRNVDLVAKTGISSLIGQTEGTCFIDFNYDNSTAQGNPLLFSFRNTAWTNEVYAQILASGGIQVQTYLGGVQQSYLYYGGATNGHHKIAYAYKQNDFILYVDGVQVATDTSGNVPATDDFCLGYFNTSFTPTVNYNAAALWKTRLTNTQLAQLTTI